MTNPVADFAELGVPSALVDALHRQGVTAPFAIQTATIPDGLAGRDVLGRAPTGSGKTLAFGVPLLAGLRRSRARRPGGLVLSPTRELAEQIRRELEPLAAAVDRRVLAVYGGVALGPQAAALRRGVDLLVACPGRLQDLVDRGEVALDQVRSVVVDEADRMADMGFLPAVRSLLDLTPPDRQTVLFSATLDRDVEVLIDQYQRDPVTHRVGSVEPDLTTVTHRFIATAKETKLSLAADLIDDTGPTMVFCRTRHGVDRVARQLKRSGIKAGWIHGGRTQSQRDAALSAFTSGRVAALVATDVAARGIHVDGVACVIHYDPPADSKDYVHRSGRTARAGAGGLVISLVNDDQRRAVARLQRGVGLAAEEPEPTPSLSARPTPAWVEQRPGRARSGRPTKPKTKPQAKTRPQRKTRPPAKTKPPANGTAATSQQPGTEPRANSGPEAKAGTTAERRPEPQTGGRPKPKAKTKQGQPRRTRNGRPAGTAGKPKGARNKTKRSGRPRTKNHKQARRSTG